MHIRQLIPILGDQLSLDIAALDGADRTRDRLLMMEVAEEATYVRHHKRKIAFTLSAMRHHAEALRSEGWQVDYVTLDDPDNSGSFCGEVARAVDRLKPDAITMTEPGEWRVASMVAQWQARLGLPVDVREDRRFIATHADFNTWANARRSLRMEYFYREMRRKTGLLMAGDTPIGGQWNFDADNRKAPPRDAVVPRPPSFPADAITRDVLRLVAARFPDHSGSLDGFDMAVTRAHALVQQAHFLDEALARFGDYQDAMLSGAPYLWHSVLSPALNAGLLDPLALCHAVAARFDAGAVPINAAEGFIRQIIGWREYVRSIYWREGPDYMHRNALAATRALPGFYWTGDTDMRCLRESIGQTLDLAYAHHIQRLMVTGNFALLIGADPHAVHQWYLAVYADAYEWVEAPNTIGMSQFADGGLLASKPYAASGAYINRMSNYCRGCRYDVKARSGPDACPFNALYWDFLARNEARLGGNPRLAMPDRTWANMDAATRQMLRESAATFLDTLD